MGSYHLKPALLCLLHFILAFHILQGQSAPAPPTGFPCNLVDCGHGTCNPSIILFPPFECVCDPGWKQIELGPIKFPPCVLPNCTLNLTCGGAHPPPSPPPLPPASSFPLLFPPINFSDPCNYTNCGDGTCVRTEGSGHRCDCNEGYVNLLNNTDLLCVPLCAIGVDCNLGLSPPPPPPHTSDTSRNDPGLREDRSFSAKRHGLKVLLLAAILFPWI